MNTIRPADPARPCPLSRLPIELRLMLLEHILVSHTTIRKYRGRGSRIWWSPYIIPSAILATCRTLHDEGIPILYAKNKFMTYKLENAAPWCIPLIKHVVLLRGLGWFENDFWDDHDGGLYRTLKAFPGIQVLTVVVCEPLYPSGTEIERFEVTPQVNAKALRTMCYLGDTKVPKNLQIIVKGNDYGIQMSGWQPQPMTLASLQQLIQQTVVWPRKCGQHYCDSLASRVYVGCRSRVLRVRNEACGQQGYELGRSSDSACLGEKAGQIELHLPLVPSQNCNAGFMRRSIIKSAIKEETRRKVTCRRWAAM